MNTSPSRRHVLRVLGGAAASVLAGRTTLSAQDANVPALTIAPEPLFELSPWLYMQFMEPLGTTDGSIEASWNHMERKWRPDLVAATQELAPPMMRWGGLFSAYYRWREGVGPREQRRPMHNLVWGGVESNQIGTMEFLDFCRQVKADPLMCVNFEAEGDPRWSVNELGEERAGKAEEAAAWVDYCNNPENKERISHGFRETLPIKVWQLGNETSYAPSRFKKEWAIRKTVEFSEAMRKVDPTIQLIAWGDSGWAPEMIERAGASIDYVAFHHLFDPGAPLSDAEYAKDPSATWAALMGSVKRHERKLLEMRGQVEKTKFALALTECHFTMRGRNRCDLNSAWATGVAYARFMNLHQRHGDLLKIANIGDFCGTRWQTNVVMIPTPGGKSYLMPVAKVAALYRKLMGRHFVRVNGGPEELDVTASRTGEKFYLHAVNTDRTRTITTRLAVQAHALVTARTYSIAVDPFVEITSAESDPMRVQEKVVDPNALLEFPAASVTVVDLTAKA